MADKNEFYAKINFDHGDALSENQKLIKSIESVKKAQDDLSKTKGTFDGFTADIKKANREIEKSYKSFDEIGNAAIKSAEAKERDANASQKLERVNKKLTKTQRGFWGELKRSEVGVKALRTSKLGMATASNLLSGNLLKAGKALRLFFASLNVSPIIVFTAAVTALNFAYDYYQANLSRAAKAEKRYQVISEKTLKIARELTKQNQKYAAVVGTLDKQTQLNRKANIELLSQEIDLKAKQLEQLKAELDAEKAVINARITELARLSADRTAFGVARNFFANKSFDRELEGLVALQEEYDNVSSALDDLSGKKDEISSGVAEVLFAEAQTVATDTIKGLQTRLSILNKAKNNVEIESDLAATIKSEIEKTQKQLDIANKSFEVDEKKATKAVNAIDELRKTIKDLKKELSQSIASGDVYGALLASDRLNEATDNLEEYENRYREFLRVIQIVTGNAVGALNKVSTASIESSVTNPTETPQVSSEGALDAIIERYEVEAQQRILLAQKTINSEEDLNAAILKINLETDKKILQSKLLVGDLTEKNTLEILNSIESINRELQTLGEDVDTENLDKFKEALKDLFNVDDEGLEAIQDAFEYLAQSAIQLGNYLYDARLRTLDAELQAIEERKDKIEQGIEDEKERYDKGYANSYQARKAQLEDLERLEKEKAAEMAEFQKKQAKVNFITESANQALNLATAISNLYKTIPEPITATILAGAMVTAFIAMRRQAYQQIQALSEGDYLGSHIGDHSERIGQKRTSGQIDPHYHGKSDKNGQRGMRIEGTNVVVNGAEYLINDRTTRKQFGFIEKLNSGQFDNLDLMSMIDNQIEPNVFLPTFKNVQQFEIINKSLHKDDMEKIVKNAVEKLIHHRESKEETTMVGNHIVRKKGNVITRQRVSI